MLLSVYYFNWQYPSRLTVINQDVAPWEGILGTRVDRKIFCGL